MSTLPAADAQSAPIPTLDEVVAQIFQMLDDNLVTAINASALFPAAPPPASAPVEPHAVGAETPQPVTLVGVHGGASVHG